MQAASDSVRRGVTSDVEVETENFGIVGVYKASKGRACRLFLRRMWC
jgi:hypothetical protein